MAMSTSWAMRAASLNEGELPQPDSKAPTASSFWD